MPASLPHVIVPPQPSGHVPQFLPLGHTVIGVQAGEPHALDVPPPPQVSGGVQLPPLVPQVIDPPQPSAHGPQFFPAGHVVIGVHAGEPQTPGDPPPPHVAGDVHAPPFEPHVIVPPHPSPIVPQLMPEGHAVAGVHAGCPHWNGTPPPPHVCWPVQMPHV